MHELCQQVAARRTETPPLSHQGRPRAKAGGSSRCPQLRALLSCVLAQHPTEPGAKGKLVLSTEGPWVGVLHLAGWSGPSISPALVGAAQVPPQVRGCSQVVWGPRLSQVWGKHSTTTAGDPRSTVGQVNGARPLLEKV